MKLYDFECSTCDRHFEEFVASEVHTMPCIATGCAGTARRMLGGKPAFHSGGGHGASHVGGPDHIGVRMVGDGDVVRVPVPSGADFPEGTRVVMMAHGHDEGGDCRNAIGLGTVVGTKGGDA